VSAWIVCPGSRRHQRLAGNTSVEDRPVTSRPGAGVRFPSSPRRDKVDVISAYDGLELTF